VAHTGGIGGRGGYAERAVVPVADLTPVPPGLPVAAAAALLHDGSTAFMLTARVPIRPAEWVLVTAAGGGMGVLLGQLARAFGGRVIAAARREITVHRLGHHDQAAFRTHATTALAVAAAGRLRPIVGQAFPLNRAAEAHAAIEARATIAKTLLLTDQIPA
jgi:NADPH:quinone reductase